MGRSEQLLSRRDVSQFAGISVTISDQILFYLSAVCSGL